MYAIVANGNKQYKAEVGSTIKFEKLNGNVGDKVELNVLMVSDDAGVKVAEEAKGFKAVGEVLEQGKNKKVVVFKYKAKKNERKKQGHRQPFTAVKVEKIEICINCCLTICSAKNICANHCFFSSICNNCKETIFSPIVTEYRKMCIL